MAAGESVSYLKNAMGGGVWQATVRSISKESDMAEVTEHICT